MRDGCARTNCSPRRGAGDEAAAALLVAFLRRERVGAVCLPRTFQRAFRTRGTRRVASPRAGCCLAGTHPPEHVDTYVKVAGRWSYLYRAIDQHAQVIDVLASERRDGAAARAFFTRAMRCGPAPVEGPSCDASVWRRRFGPRLRFTTPAARSTRWWPSCIAPPTPDRAVAPRPPVRPWSPRAPRPIGRC
jgi:DDE domain